MTKENLNTEKYIYLIYQTFVDSLENKPQKAIEQKLILATDDENIAKEYCDNSAILTVEDCWAIAYAKEMQLNEFNCQKIPLNKEIDVSGLTYE